MRVGLVLTQTSLNGLFVFIKAVLTLVYETSILVTNPWVQLNTADK